MQNVYQIIVAVVVVVAILDGISFCADADFDLRLKDLLFPSILFSSIQGKTDVRALRICLHFAFDLQHDCLLEI